MSPCETCPNLVCSVCCPCQLLDEPVWAIGTGLVCPSAVAQEVRTHISMQYVYVSTWRGVHTDTLCTWVRTTAHTVLISWWSWNKHMAVCVNVGTIRLECACMRMSVCGFQINQSPCTLHYLSILPSISFDCPASCSPISLYFVTRHFTPL